VAVAGKSLEVARALAYAAAEELADFVPASQPPPQLDSSFFWLEVLQVRHY
jgi:hypothetical protein